MNADALSRFPVLAKSTHTPSDSPHAVVAATRPPSAPAKGGEADLATLQRQDTELFEVIDYLENGTLPADHKRARELALCKSQYAVLDGVLYHVENDKTLRVIPPQSRREELFQEVHGGMFGGHLRDAKVHGNLSRHYWWPGMRADILKWCKACLTCASRHVGRAVKPPLTPIPVSGPFDRIGVDVIQFPRSYDGNQYAVVFVDYLTKWPEVFPVSDQTALTIARLLVESIICRHGVPVELLSDRGRAFLSGLMQEVYQLMGIHKVATTAYHPQTDGLVERFNRTLTDMLAKTVESNGRDWDRRLPYVLFAYRTSPQESTKESPFFLLYGRDPQLPTEAALTRPKTRYQVDLEDYKTELVSGLSEAWTLARQQVQKAQKQQKRYYDRRATSTTFQVGDRVFTYMPSAKTGKAYKFARPFHGPYRVLELTTNDARICPVDKPQDPPIFVALDRIRHCPCEIPPDEFWPQRKRKKKAKEDDDSHLESTVDDDLEQPPSRRLKETNRAPTQKNPMEDWSQRLRPRGTRPGD